MLQHDNLGYTISMKCVNKIRNVSRTQSVLNYIWGTFTLKVEFVSNTITSLPWSDVIIFKNNKEEHPGLRPLILLAYLFEERSFQSSALEQIGLLYQWEVERSSPFIPLPYSLVWVLYFKSSRTSSLVTCNQLRIEIVCLDIQKVKFVGIKLY